MGVVVQIYYTEMYDEVKAVYPFENFLLTLYYIGYPDIESGESKEMMNFMAENGIPVLAILSGWWSESLRNDLEGSGIKVFVHTVNEEPEAKERLAQGVAGIYTDDILQVLITRWMKETRL